MGIASAQYKHKQYSGFTIIELAVIIFVLGILSTVGFFAFGAWRERAAETELKNDLNGVATAMDSARNWGNGYPELTPGVTFNGNDETKNIFLQSDGVILTYYEGDDKSYCIDAVSKDRPNVTYFLDTDGDKSAQKGTCAGGDPVIVANVTQHNTGGSGTWITSFSATSDLSRIFVNGTGFTTLYSQDGGASWNNLYNEGPISDELWSNHDSIYGAYSINKVNISPSGNTAWIDKRYSRNLPPGASITSCVARLIPNGSLWSIGSDPDCSATRTSPYIESIAISENGSIVAVVDQASARLKLSVDGGGAWDEKNVCGCGGGNLGAVIMSFDGTVMIGKHSNKLVVSTDTGSTWLQHADPSSTQNWAGGTLAISGDGGTMAYSAPDRPRASPRPDSLYVSRDQGQTWGEYMADDKLFWRSVSISFDGRKMVGIASPNPATRYSGRSIYASNNYGSTWVELTQLGTNQWEDIIVSADGTRVVAAAIEEGSNTIRVHAWDL